MIKSLLSTVLLCVFVAGGAFGAMSVKSSKTAEPSEHSDTKKDKKKSKDKKDKKKSKDKGHDDKSSKKDKKKKDKKSKKGHGKDKKSDSHGSKGDAGGASYLKFKRQFVVPVMQGGKIDSLVIMNFNLVLNDEAPGEIFSLEPKFRAAIVKELLDLSNSGAFDEDLTTPSTYEALRENMLKAVRRVSKYGVEDILILDVAKQDQ